MLFDFFRRKRDNYCVRKVWRRHAVRGFVDLDKPGFVDAVRRLRQLAAQLIPVIKVKRLEEGEYIGRELLLIKVSCTSKKREEIMGIAQLVQAKIVDVSSSAVTLEYSEEADKIDILLELLRPFGIKEIVRTGKVAIEKGHGEAYHSGFND